jgi:2-polyprenyl-3-methyl-5-hydroxy-6-metoxy-1,4-benzoquinol methylase
MDIKKYTEANRKAWNEVSPIHEEMKKEAKKQFLEPGFSCLDEVITKAIKQIGIEGKDVAQVCCNDGVETLSLKNLGAASCTGFDISDEAIRTAELLSTEAEIPCRFVRTDIYDIPKDYHAQFDVVYISAGVFIWFPDLKRFFQVVSELLKEGGTVLIYEMHPFLNMLDEEEDDIRIKHSYFIDKPHMYDDGLTYLGDNYEGSPTYNFDPTMSQIISAIIRNGLNIKHFEEYDYDLSALFEHLEDKQIKIPMSYLISAEK